MIKILSNDTIQKIAAGEVVERPASIVKELVENSIDAKAENITVEIKRAGKDFIKVSDDGHGIKSDQVELAFERHATSKIDDFEDLYKIHSMGFRGEALASIISVARLEIKTKHKDEDIGSHLIYDNNGIVNKSSLAMNIGTSIEVYDLFKYVPARLKFLSSDITEANKITQLMYVLAIGNPHISFTYIKDNREVFKTSFKKSQDLNYETLFGKDFIKNSLHIKNESNNYKLTGTISNNRYYKGNRSMQFIYVNGRYIESKEIVDSIEMAYSNLIPSGRFPVYELKIEVDPNDIDINIHPNKQKIKFSFTEELVDVVYKTVYDALNEDLKPKELEVKERDEKLVSFYDLNQGDGYQKVLDAYKKPLEIDRKETLNSQGNEKIDEDISFSFNILDFDKEESDELPDFENIYDQEEDYIPNEQIGMEIDSLDFKASIFNKYLLFEDFNSKELLIVDTARANERIIYDRVISSDKIISQDLLRPLIVNLSNKEMEIFSQNKDYFQNLGYEIDLFDETSIAIRQVPYYYDEPSDLDNFKLILDSLEDKSHENKRDSILKSSVALASKKSRNLDKDQANLLISELRNSSDPYTSPHGKAIVYKLSKEQFVKFIDK